MGASEDFDRPVEHCLQQEFESMVMESHTLELPLSEASGLQLILPNKFQWPN